VDDVLIEWRQFEILFAEERNGEWRSLQRARHLNGNDETQGLHTQNIGTGWLPGIKRDPLFSGITSQQTEESTTAGEGAPFVELPDINAISNSW
jgi:hypothetical protein